MSHIFYCRAQELKIDVSPDQSSFVLRDIEPNVNYWVRVTANTKMGEGESTQIVTVMPVINGKEIHFILDRILI